MTILYPFLEEQGNKIIMKFKNDIKGKECYQILEVGRVLLAL